MKVTIKDEREDERTLQAEWVTISRNLFAALMSFPGTDLGDRESEESATDRRGYADAMDPMKRLCLAGKLRATDPAVWTVTFAIRREEFRPRYGRVQEIVKKALGIRELPAENPDAYKPFKPAEITPLGIPATTVDVAYKDIAMPRRHDITLEDVPTHDLAGNLLGDGRRRFLMCYHRARGGVHPNPDKTAASRDEAASLDNRTDGV